MQLISATQHLYSATDLVNFLECEHLTSLDLENLTNPLPRAKDGQQAKLVQEKGFVHEDAYVQQLKKQFASFIDISKTAKTNREKAAATIQAMKNGADIIFQATFLNSEFIGHADFLRKIDTPSQLGHFSYEVLDTKLARSAKAKFVIQLSFYSDMLAKIQGYAPQMMYVILGNQKEVSFRFSDYAHYYSRLKNRFLEHVSSNSQTTYPSPCERCDLCHWRNLCADRRSSDDHLSQVANITKIQIKRLEATNVNTLEKLAQLKPDVKITKISSPVIERLQHQASLQLLTRQTGKPCFELIKPSDSTQPEVGPIGFDRLPMPDIGDLFFDMEGNPFDEGGLEYLFGLYYEENGEKVFKPFWAHNRSEEGKAFDHFMQFVSNHLAQYPNAHIYHYAPYEVTALKKLMGLHGIRELEVDQLLRDKKMIDLYRVVRESVRVSEPSYSIKNLETFYLQKRTGDVTDAGASVVYYEKWKETQDTTLLQAIEDYNHDDVRSTSELREWLLKQRPPSATWFSIANLPTERQKKEDSDQTIQAQARLLHYRLALIGSLPADESKWSDSDRHQQLVYFLLDFYRRKTKPEWWGIFDRQSMSAEERVENTECIAGLHNQQHTPKAEKSSKIYTFKFPNQEFKIKTGDGCVFVDNLKSISDVIVNEDKQTVSFKLGQNYTPPNEPFDIGLYSVTNDKKLTEAVYRYADSLIGNVTPIKTYQAIDHLLTRQLPKITGHQSGAPIVVSSKQLNSIISAVSNLDNSYIFIQGPPGSGKTYTGSHIIVELINSGKRVGVSSNSHKAIINLLHAVEATAVEKGVQFRGAKKSDRNELSQHVNGKMIVDKFDNTAFHGNQFQLIAGTAWLFADSALEQTLDYLFVDEAGQVALAMLVSMGLSAKNIVLLGDQMQLSQPTKGVHPGESGLSVLDFLLQGKATIEPQRGIFLETTWRMHPSICQFISDAVYDGRLNPEPRNAKRELIMSGKYDPALKNAGIQFDSIHHVGCTQFSPDEVSRVCALYSDLLKQKFTDENGTIHPITKENILVVSPYNMQVNKLILGLPDGARVGTVDKFQGQEAEVVIISMATSSGEDLPRDIEFLYSKNRLNVAVSRAKCLAILIANPALLNITCKTPEQMSLVNTLCWIKGV